MTFSFLFSYSNLNYTTCIVSTKESYFPQVQTRGFFKKKIGHIIFII